MIGFGTWGLSGKDYGYISKKDASELLLLALRNGINFFDTAPLYGNGKVEKIIGNILTKDKKLRKKITICTKFGLLPHSSKKLKHNFETNNIDKSLKKSLGNLKTDYIDIYLMHSPNLSLIDINKVKNHLKKIQKKKMVKHFGISLKNPSDVFLLKDLKFFKYFEFNFNLLDQRAAQQKVFSYLRKNKKKIICRTPLCFGFLTDNLIDKKSLEKQDHRKKFWSIKQFAKWNTYKFLFNDFKKKYKINSLSVFSILFCLSYKFDYVIPGIMSKNQIVENLSATKARKINKSDLHKILKIYSKKEKKIFIKNF